MANERVAERNTMKSAPIQLPPELQGQGYLTPEVVWPVSDVDRKFLWGLCYSHIKGFIRKASLDGIVDIQSLDWRNDGTFLATIHIQDDEGNHQHIHVNVAMEVGGYFFCSHRIEWNKEALLRMAEQHLKAAHSAEAVVV